MTEEEYAVQQYEGASTLFGPWQLDAYIQEYCQMAQALRDGMEIQPGTAPQTIPDEAIKKVERQLTKQKQKERDNKHTGNEA